MGNSVGDESAGGKPGQIRGSNAKCNVPWQGLSKSGGNGMGEKSAGGVTTKKWGGWLGKRSTKGGL